MDTNAVKFTSLFERLKKCTNNDPNVLLELCRKDNLILELVNIISFLDSYLEKLEGDGFVSFISPVSPNFISERKDYLNRWRDVLNLVQLNWLLGDDMGLSFQLQPKTKDSENIEAENHGRATQYNVECLLEFARHQIEDEDRRSALGDFGDQAEMGADYLSMSLELGVIDICSIERRRKLIRPVLIPPHVAEKHGTEFVSLFTNLQEAYRAYIYGLPRASLSMCRSLIEILLSEHFRVQRSQNSQTWRLKDKINAFESHKFGVNKEHLHNVRKWANEILHDNNNVIRTQNLASKWEDKVRSSILVLKELIERCPSVRN